jgi:hypothetical protein
LLFPVTGPLIQHWLSSQRVRTAELTFPVPRPVIIGTVLPDFTSAAELTFTVTKTFIHVFPLPFCDLLLLYLLFLHGYKVQSINISSFL